MWSRQSTFTSPHFLRLSQVRNFGLCMSCFIFTFSLFLCYLSIYGQLFHCTCVYIMMFLASCTLLCGMRIFSFIEDQRVVFGWLFLSRWGCCLFDICTQPFSHDTCRCNCNEELTIIWIYIYCTEGSACQKICKLWCQIPRKMSMHL